MVEASLQLRMLPCKRWELLGKPSQIEQSREGLSKSLDWISINSFQNGGDSINVERLVSLASILEGQHSRDLPRGPFASSRDWLEARLTTAEK